MGSRPIKIFLYYTNEFNELETIPLKGVAGAQSALPYTYIIINYIQIKKYYFILLNKLPIVHTSVIK